MLEHVCISVLLRTIFTLKIANSLFFTVLRFAYKILKNSTVYSQILSKYSLYYDTVSHSWCRGANEITQQYKIYMNRLRQMHFLLKGTTTDFFFSFFTLLLYE